MGKKQFPGRLAIAIVLLSVCGGFAAWNEPVTHQVENIGTTHIHLIVVELKEGQI